MSGKFNFPIPSRAPLLRYDLAGGRRGVALPFRVQVGRVPAGPAEGRVASEARARVGAPGG